MGSGQSLCRIPLTTGSSGDPGLERGYLNPPGFLIKDCGIGAFEPKSANDKIKGSKVLEI